MIRAETPNDTPAIVAARIVKRHKSNPAKLASIGESRVRQAWMGGTVHGVSFNLAVQILLTQRHLPEPQTTA